MQRQVDDLWPFGVSSWCGAGAFPKPPQQQPVFAGATRPSELVEEFLLVSHNYIPISSVV